jgi:putative transposase
MKGTKFTETLIVKILKDLDTGKPALEIAREHGISKATLYIWRKKYNGMGASELSELKALKEENRRLNHMYAELALDHRLAKEIIEKKL